MIAVDAERGFEEDWQIKPWLAGAHPYGAWLDGGLVSGSSGSPSEPPEDE